MASTVDVAAGPDNSRPLAVAYLRAHLLTTEDELADAKRDLAAFAEREGYTLGQVHVERLDHAPAAFEALVAEVMREQVIAVIVPGTHHLAALGSPPSAIRYHLERTTGVRVLRARHSP